MRVIEERPVLMQWKLVDESLARHDRLLPNAGHAVHLDRQFETVPVNASRLRQVVLKNNSNAIALVRLDRRARRASIKTPKIENAPRDDRLLHRLGGEVEDLHPVLHAVRQVWYV